MGKKSQKKSRTKHLLKKRKQKQLEKQYNVNLAVLAGITTEELMQGEMELLKVMKQATQLPSVGAED